MNTESGNLFLLNAQSGDQQGVSLYLDSGGDPNFTGQPKGITALLLAVKEGHTEIARDLLDRGADVHCRTERGLSCVHAVAMTGSEKMFELLLEYGIRDMDTLWMPSLYCRSVYTPLYMAAQENHSKVLQMMLIHGADPLQEIEVEPGPVKLKACEVALNLGNSECVNLFVLWCHRLGPFSVEAARELPAHKPESVTSLLATIMDKLENLALMARKREMDDLSVVRDCKFRKFLDATQSGDLGSMSVYADSYSVSATTPMGLSALHMAAQKGNMDSVRFLLSHGALVNIQSQSGLSPLYLAAQEGHVHIVELLLKAGADPCLGLKCGIAPLGIALSMHHKPVVSLILARCPLAPAVSTLDTKYINKQPDRLLLRAAEKGDLDQVKYCIDDLGMDPNKVTSLLGIKAIHFACQRGHTSILQELLNNSASVNSRTKKGHEPMHCAAFGGHMDVLNILLHHGAAVDCQTENGATPLYVASQLNNTDFAETLLQKGADPLKAITGDFTCVDVARLNASVDVLNLLLHWAFRVGTFSSLPEHIEQLPCFSEDHTEKVQSKILGGIGEMALSQQIKEFDAALKTGSESVQQLLEESQRGNTYYIKSQAMLLHNLISTSTQVSALHCASFGGHLDTVQFLLTCGLDLNRQTKAGFTPLYLASQQGQLEVVECLLEAGAHPGLYARIGLTAVGVAMYTRQRHIVTAILDHTPSIPPIHPAGTFCQKQQQPDKKKSLCVLS